MTVPLIAQVQRHGQQAGRLPTDIVKSTRRRRLLQGNAQDGRLPQRGKNTAQMILSKRAPGLFSESPLRKWANTQMSGGGLSKPGMVKRV